MPVERFRLATGISLLAGAMDATTGLLLVAIPATTLALFGAAMPGGDGSAILMRFVGAFVCGTGLSYVWAITPREPVARSRRLSGVWGATAVVRTCIALFVFAAVGFGELEPAWLVVGLTDAALAIVQATGMRRGWTEAGP